MLPTFEGLLDGPVAPVVFAAASDNLLLCRLADGAVLAANPAAGRLVGAPVADLTRRTLIDLLPDSPISGVEQSARLVRADGSACAVVWWMMPTGTAGVGLAVIRPAAAADLAGQAEVQRLEGLAHLIGNVTHACNNLLTGILGYTVLTRQELAGENPAQHHLTQIEQGGQQAAALCHQLLAYLRRRGGARSQVLQRLIEEMQDLLQVAVGRRARVVFQMAPGLPEVTCDARWFCQALLDLVLVAASPARGDVIPITVATGTMPVSRALLEEIEPGAGLPEGEYVYLEVANSPGPTATGKEGSRPNLTVIREIARAHRGALQMTESPERGSVFRLLLPLAPGTVARPNPWMGHGPVLVVDDEDTLSRMLSHLLNTVGLPAETVSNGTAALERLRADSQRYRLVLLDLHMPAPDGLTVLRELRGLRPDLPVVVMSGLIEAEADRAFGPGPTALLQKPFVKEDLLRVLRKVLGGEK
jgi:two-component system, cell cycle sensor histidine kinase and response regulator CckA